jgi:uncharacterized membrane protein AbrB (regulator of aidB expression)
LEIKNLPFVKSHWIARLVSLALSVLVGFGVWWLLHSLLRVIGNTAVLS